MKYLKSFAIFLILLSLSGCSLNPFWGGTTHKQELNIPKAPERGFDEIEDIRRNVDIVTDISHIAYTSGVSAYSYESDTLLASAKVLQTVTGLPTEPINLKLKKEVEKLHENILENEREYRSDRLDWENLIKGLEEDNSTILKENRTLKGLVDKFKFWFYFCLIVLGALCFFAPTIGIPLVRFLLGRVKKLGETAVVETASAFKGQMKQVVDAIEEFKQKDPQKAKELLDELHKKTDSKTRNLIREIKGY
jgi:hypothetical protein